MITMGSKVKVLPSENEYRPADRQVDTTVLWMITDTDDERAIIRRLSDDSEDAQRWVVSVDCLEKVDPAVGIDANGMVYFVDGQAYR